MEETQLQTPEQPVRFLPTWDDILLVDHHKHLLQFHLLGWSKLPAALFLTRRICGISGHCQTVFSERAETQGTDMVIISSST